MGILSAYRGVGREGKGTWGRKKSDKKGGGKKGERKCRLRQGKVRRICRWYPRMGTGRER